MEYLIKVSAILFIFYACYKLFLEKETFFESNRWFLLVGLITAISLPSVTIPIYITKVAPQSSGFVFEEGMQIASTVESSSLWIDLLSYAYIAGLLFFAIKFSLQIISLISLILKSEKFKARNFTYVKINDDVSPFSFFNYIVYNPTQYNEDDLQHIIRHEKVHVNQLHSLDILLTHLATLINWFNPLFWLYKKELQQNLEFIADHQAQKQSECQKTYQHLLLKTTMPNYKMALANNFYNSLIKKRIVMLHKNRSKNTNQWKIAIVLPLLALFLMSFNTKEIITYETPENVIASEAIIDTFGEVVELLVSKDMTDDELKDISKKMEKKGVTIKFKGVKRNNSNEITDIEIVVKTKSSNASHRSSNDEPIKPIKIVIKDNNSISIGNGHDTGHRDFVFETKDGEHEIHTTKKSGNVFIHSSDHDDDEVHEIIEHEDGKIIIKKGGENKIIHKGEGSAIFISDDDGDYEKIEIIEEGDGKSIVIRDGKKIVIKKDKDGNIKNEWIERDGDNIWISEDEDGDNIFKIKGKNKLFFSSGKGKNPLFILDGKEVSKDVIDELDSENIETIEVLKGDSADKKYGKKGKDGVVLIKSKDN